MSYCDITSNMFLCECVWGEGGGANLMQVSVSVI